jgi:hypothetical protein
MNEAYLDLLERQSRRGLCQLPDRRTDVERQQHDLERRQILAAAFGDWIAHSLGSWDWFVNPISFRDRHPALEFDPKTGEPRHYPIKKRVGPVRVFVDDPRLKSWKPDFRGRQSPGPPVPDRALVEIKDWLFDLQKAADHPIRWMIAEEFGNIEGRYHCHALVAGVAHLRRDEWWEKAFEQFGRTKISPFDADKGGAFYAAKYATKKLGALHFGGPLPDAKFSALLNPSHAVGRLSVTPSAQMSRAEFRGYEFTPRGWSGWRSKR